MIKSRNVCIIGSSCSFGSNIKKSLESDFFVYETNRKILDVTKIEDIKKYFSMFDSLHGLVYCSAIKNDADSLSNPEILSNLLSVNLFGAVNCLQTALPKIHNGKIVIIGSVDATFANYQKTMYSVSKAALHQFAKCFAIQAKQFNVETICLVPGTIKNESEKQAIANFISCFMKNQIGNLHGQLIRIDGGHHTFPL